MLVACCSSTYYLALPISLNSLDREGVRLLSPCDSQITSKTRCRDRWCRSRWCAWAQVGVRRRLSPLLCIFPWWSVVVPSWGDRGPCRMLGLIFYFGTIVGPWVYWMIVMLFMYSDWCMIYLCFLWSDDCKPTLYPILVHYMGLCEDDPSCDKTTLKAMSQVR